MALHSAQTTVGAALRGRPSSRQKAEHNGRPRSAAPTVVREVQHPSINIKLILRTVYFGVKQSVKVS